MTTAPAIVIPFTPELSVEDELALLSAHELYAASTESSSRYNAIIVGRAFQIALRKTGLRPGALLERLRCGPSTFYRRLRGDDELDDWTTLKWMLTLVYVMEGGDGR